MGANPDMPSDYLGYISAENHSVGTYWNSFSTDLTAPLDTCTFKEGGYRCYFYPGGSSNRISIRSSFTDSYGNAPPNMGDKVFRIERWGGNRTYYSVDASSPYHPTHPHPNHPLYHDMYMSYWVYLPNSFYSELGSAWTYFWQRKEFHTVDRHLGANRETEIAFLPRYWVFAVMRPDSGSESDQRRLEEACIKVYMGDGWIDERIMPDPRPTIYYPADGFDIPRARWFRLELWNKQTTSDTGEFKIWIYDPNNATPARRSMQLLFSATDCRTRHETYPRTIMNAHHYLRHIEEGYYSDETYIYNYNVHGETYTVDACIEKPDATSTYTVDTCLQKQYAPTYTVDAHLADVTPIKYRDYTVDSCIEKTGITSTYMVDASLRKQFDASTYTVDAVLEGRGLPTYTVDACLEKTDNLRAYYVSAVLGATGEYARTYWLDGALSKADVASTYTVDAVLSKADVAPTPSPHALLFGRFQKIPTPRKAIVDGDPVLVDEGPECRVDVFTTDWESMLKRFTRASSESGTEAWKKLLKTFERT